MLIDFLDMDMLRVFLLIFARTAAMVALIPYFAWGGVPVVLRAFISLGIAFLLYLALGEELVLYSPDNMLISVVMEVLVGLALGLLISIFFTIFLMAGEMVSRQAGLMLARQFDPTFEEQVNIIGQFYSMLALILYLTIDGHHLLLMGMSDSFEMIPLGAGLLTPQLMDGVIAFSADVLTIAFQISAPIVVTLIVLNFSLGLLAKAAPQMHVFMLSLPLKIMVTMILIGLSIPIMADLLIGLLDWFMGVYYQIMQGWLG